MRWFSIDRVKIMQPESGTWRNWKQSVREYCNRQCVYCSIHESRFGGMRNFHVDHFRPKSLFTKFENVISNLFYACSVCNAFKGNDWPGEPENENGMPWYLDPVTNNYNECFIHCDQTNGFHICGSCNCSKYMVERLHLNRRHLILERREDRLFERIEDLEPFLRALGSSIKSGVSDLRCEKVGEIVEIFAEISALRGKLRKAEPYAVEDLR